MIISMYLAQLLIVALFAFESIMPEWLGWVCVFGPLACYMISDIRYSQLKKRVKELEEWKTDALEMWRSQININSDTHGRLHILEKGGDKE